MRRCSIIIDTPDIMYSQKHIAQYMQSLSCTLRVLPIILEQMVYILPATSSNIFEFHSLISKLRYLNQS